MSRRNGETQVRLKSRSTEDLVDRRHTGDAIVWKDTVRGPSIPLQKRKTTVTVRPVQVAGNAVGTGRLR